MPVFSSCFRDGYGIARGFFLALVTTVRAAWPLSAWISASMISTESRIRTTSRASPRMRLCAGAAPGYPVREYLPGKIFLVFQRGDHIKLPDAVCPGCPGDVVQVKIRDRRGDGFPVFVDDRKVHQGNVEFRIG